MSRRGGGLRARSSAPCGGSGARDGAFGLLLSELLQASQRSTLVPAGRCWCSFRITGNIDPTRPPQSAHASTGGFREAHAAGGGRGPGRQRAVVAGFRGIISGERPAERSLWSPSLPWLPREISPGVWRLPVSGAATTETRLDGRKVSVSIEAGGQVGRGRDSGRGSCSRGSSIVCDRREAGFEVLSFAVNPIAVARVLVDWRRSGTAHRCWRRRAGRLSN